MWWVRAPIAAAGVLLATLASAAPQGAPSPSSTTSSSSSSPTSELGALPATPSASAKPKPAPKVEPKPEPKKGGKDKDVKKKDDAPKKPLTSPNAAAQKLVAGGPTSLEATGGAESLELRALRDAEIDLFAGAAPAPPSAWPSELPSPPKGPLANAGGLPPAPVDPPPVDAAVGGGSLAWLSGLAMPDLPVRWDARVVRYLEFFKDDPRGRKIMSTWLRRSGRYRALIQQALRARSMPEDLAWVAMAESGFDPLIRSPAGATGLWQFMPDAARVYGLTTDRWADARSSPPRATEAAIQFLGDLKKRFGTWELALAAYNMGYGGALAVVKRFNSNDYWELSRYENGLPWETTLYVPKILAIAIVARNVDAFGFEAVTPEPPLAGEPVEVPAGADLRAIAALAGCTFDELKALNPELRAGRVPPATAGKDGALAEPSYAVLVPPGKSGAVRDGASKLSPKGSALERYVVRFGETLDQVAAAHKTTKGKLVELNGIGKDEVVRAGAVLLVPPAPTSATPTAGTALAVAPEAGKPVVLVPSTLFAYPNRERVFYRVIVGDTPRDIADAFGVGLDELRAWNAIEPTARLQEAMTLQLFVPKGLDLSRVVHSKDGEVRIVAVGSDEFYAIEEAQKGKKRLTIPAAGGETLEQLGKKYGVSPASMEKINRRPRTDVLAKGEGVIVYVAAKASATTPSPTDKSPSPALAEEQPALPAAGAAPVEDSSPKKPEPPATP